MRTLSIIFLLCFSFSLAHPQTKELTSEALISYQGKLYESEGVVLNGAYKITENYDGSYLTASFNDGFEQGITSSYTNDHVLISTVDVFYNIGIESKIYDEAGKIIEKNILYEVEVLEEKKSKKGLITDGRVKLVGDGQYYIIELIKGNKHGLEAYFENNIMRLSSTYNKGYLVNSKEYDSNGKSISQTNYCKVYLATDTRRQIDYSDFIWDNGKDGKGNIIWQDKDLNPLQGEYIMVDKGFVIKTVGSFDGGKYDGNIKSFDDNGVLTEDYTYRKGELDGLSIKYDYSSISKTHYRSGVKHGLYTRLNLESGTVDDLFGNLKDEQGFLSDSVNFVNGVMDGIQQKRWEDGEHAKYNYVKGKLHGKVQTYYKLENGKDYLQSIEYYVYGAKNGLFIEYDSLGNLVSEKKYKFDKLNGVSNFYENGKLIRTERYRMGKDIERASFDSDGNKVSESKLEGIKRVSTEYYLSGVVSSIAECDENSRWEEGSLEFIKEFNEKGELTKEVYSYLRVKELVKLYTNDRLVSEISSPAFPEDGSIQEITYYSKKGEVQKKCSTTYDEIGGEGGYGGWRKEECK